MSPATLCASPLRSFQISAAASPDAAMLTCAAAATRNDDGNSGSLPVSVTAPSAAGSPPADVQTSARLSSGVFLGLCIAINLAAFCWHTFSERCPTGQGVAMAAIDPLTAGGVLLA